MSDLERLLERCIPEPNTGCWLWVASLVTGGYGAFKMNQRSVRAHRASWLLHFGDIAPGLCVCHRCDNPPCVNPAHLFLGTHGENKLDSMRKGRIGKLSADQALDVRRRALLGERYSTIAADYGISESSISHIRSGARRSYLPDLRAELGEGIVDDPRIRRLHSRALKLTPEVIRGICAEYKPHKTSRPQLARKYGLSRATIDRVLSGRAAHLAALGLSRREDTE